MRDAQGGAANEAILAPMQPLETLREQLKTLGPSAVELLPTLDALENEFELRARRIAALSIASHITAALAGGKGGTPVLDNVLMATLALSNAERSLIAVADHAPSGYRIVAERSQPGTASWPVSDEAIRAALGGDSRLLTPELRRDERDAQLLVAAFRSAMATPILFEDGVIGCLYLDIRGPERSFSHADFETFRVFGRHASPALGMALERRNP